MRIAIVTTAGVALAALIIVGYVTAYISRSEFMPDCLGNEPAHVRHFNTETEATIFHPAARVESAMLGRTVLSRSGLVIQK